MKNFGKSACLCALFFSLTTSVLRAQPYIDVEMHQDFYRFNAPLNIENDRLLYGFTIGWVSYVSDSERFKLAIEIGTFSRRFSQSFTDSRFRYKFFGLSFGTISSYRIADKLHLDAGFDVAVYTSHLEGATLGSGFNSADIGLQGGLSYYFVEWFALGARYTRYLVPMLKYEPIGNYGEFEPTVKDIFTQRLSLFIRFQFPESKEE